jgi:hypothetical protein
MKTSGKGTCLNESSTPTVVGINAVAATTRVAFAVAVPGARTTDFAVPRINAAALEAGLIIEGVVITAANVATVYVYNRTAGALPVAAFSLDVMLLPTDQF